MGGRATKNILCYGDSNAWGHVPAKGTRYPGDVRWPGVMARRLGGGYRVIEDSVSGRTTLWEDLFCPNRCGMGNLGYSLLAHAPLDLVILSLGTNDLKFTDAAGAQKGIARIIDLIYNADAQYGSFSPIFAGQKRVLLLGPVRIAPEIETLRPGHQLARAAEPSRELAGRFEQVAREKHTWFLDASALVYPSLEDCLHLSERSHRELGEAVAGKVLEIFGETAPPRP